MVLSDVKTYIPSVAVGLVGVVVLVLAAVSFSGNGPKFSGSTFFGRPAIGLCFGLGLVLASVAQVARRGGGDSLFALCWAGIFVLVVLLLWFAFVGTPKWATPSWQRSNGEEHT